MTEPGYFTRLVRRAVGTVGAQVHIRRPDAPASGEWSDVSVSADTAPAEIASANVQREPATAAATQPLGGDVSARAVRRDRTRPDGNAAHPTAPLSTHSRLSDEAGAPGSTPSQRRPATEHTLHEHAAQVHAPNGHVTTAHAANGHATNDHAIRTHGIEQHVTHRDHGELDERGEPGIGVARAVEPIAVTTERASESASRGREPRDVATRTHGIEQHVTHCDHGELDARGELGIGVEGAVEPIAVTTERASESASRGREPRDVVAWQVRRAPSPRSVASAPGDSAQVPVTIGEVRVEIVEPHAALVAAPTAAHAVPAIRTEGHQERPLRHAFGLAQL